MIKNYFKIAVRHFWRYRGFTLINGLGLMIGMAACIVLAIYVRYEASYDRFFPNYERIYRVVTDDAAGGELERSAVTAAPVAPFLLETLPDVEAATRLFKGSFEFERGTTVFQEKQVFFADSTVFDVLGMTLIQGDPTTALDNPFSVVMTPAAAGRYFGDEDPVGQTLRINREVDAMVTGVLMPLTANAHLDIQILGSMSSVEAMQSWLFTNWVSAQFYTYIRVRPGTDATALSARMNSGLQQRAATIERETAWAFKLALEPLSEIYLTSDRTQQAGPIGSASMMSILGLIGFFILLLACVNFINLSTARAAERVREVGVRKAVGARREQVAAQFLIESMLLSFCSLLLAMGIVWLSLPAFAAYLGKPLVVGGGELPWMLGMVAFLWLVVGIAAGSYPAFYLARFKPALVIKGKHGSEKGRMRRALVVLQFTISITLVAATAVIFSQIEYVNAFDPGFRRQHMVAIPFGEDTAIRQQLDAVKASLLQQPGVEGVTASSESPAASLRDGNWLMTVETADGTMIETAMTHLLVDAQFLDVYEIDIVAGRGFSEEFVSDSSGALVINEAAAAQLGFQRPEQAVGRRFDAWPSGGVIIGVVRSFNFRSLHEAIQPLALRVIPEQVAVLTLRLSTGDLESTLAGVETVWRSFGSRRPFTYTFLDEAGAAQYTSERRLGQTLAGFSALAIFIACLGLLGLMAFSAERRTKEIGIRKILGASVAQIARLLTRELLSLVLVASVVATPIAYLLTDVWLGQFAYRLPGAATQYLLAGVLALLIAVLTVGAQAVTIALRDPVDSLRYE